MMKIYDSLSLSTTMFIDCVGSHLFNIYNYFSDENSKNDIMFYLLNCKLKYVKLDLDEIKKTYFDNPWGYQPVKLYTNSNGELFNMETYNEFCIFLSDTFNLAIYNENIDRSMDIIDNINLDMENDKVVIAFVDEKYIPHSLRFYNKQTNYHGLLIKKMDKDRRSYSVLDPEFSGEYEVPFENMREAIIANGAGYVAVQCKNFKNELDIINRFDVSNLGKMDFFTDFIEDISYRLDSGTSDNPEYFHKGYYFSILFKIIPFVKMRNQYLKMLRNVSNDIISQSLKIQQLWQVLPEIMLKQANSSDFSKEIILSSLKQISDEETKLIIRLK